MNIPSKLIEKAVEQFATLPGIGERTALRLTLFMLNQQKEYVLKFSNAFSELIENINFCKKCFNISENQLCSICSNTNRDATTICVIENIKDLFAIEATQQFKGTYHVLGGVISPMDGIGPQDLKIEELIGRCDNEIKEVILALPGTMEGDTTSFYLYKRLRESGIKLSAIARGVAVGDVIEYTDEITLGRSIINRTEYKTNF